MEDVLEVYSRPYDEDYPVICMDEKPVQFLPTSAKDSAPKRTAFNMRTTSISATAQQAFSFLQSLWRMEICRRQERRTSQDWAKQIEWLLTKQYPMDQEGRSCNG